MISQELKEARILNLINRAINPSTMEIAYHCSLKTIETREILRELEARGKVKQVGRSWIVPSRALPEPTPMHPIPEWEEGIEYGGPLPGEGRDDSKLVAFIICVIVLLILAGIFGLISWARNLAGGGF